MHWRRCVIFIVYQHIILYLFHYVEQVHFMLHASRNETKLALWWWRWKCICSTLQNAWSMFCSIWCLVRVIQITKCTFPIYNPIMHREIISLLCLFYLNQCHALWHLFQIFRFSYIAFVIFAHKQIAFTVHT